MSPYAAPELLLLALLGAIVALDQDAGLGLHLSQPLVAGALTGLVLGRFEAGVSAGGVVQLVWMAAQPVGGARLPDLGLGGVVAALAAPTAAAAGGLLHAEFLAAPAALGIAAAWGGGALLRAQRRLHDHWLADLTQLVEEGDVGALARLHERTLLVHALRGVVVVLVAAAVAPRASELLAAAGLRVEAARLAAGLGIVTLLRVAGSGKRRALLAGFLVGLLPGVL